MAKKNSTKTTEYLSASDFIRHQPLGVPAKDVVKAAARIGIELNAGLVRVTRFKMRRAGGEPVPRGRQPRAGNAMSAPRGLETEFRRLVFELGTLRAQALVAEVATAFDRLGL